MAEPIDLRADGVLWMVNRAVFHPRGYALAVDSATGDFSILGDGSEVWTFTQEDDDECFAAFQALMKRLPRATDGD